MRLGEFILTNTEPILAEWEEFARGIWPGAATDPATLRDDAEDMLRAAAADMKSNQTATQQSDKSRGKSGNGSSGGGGSNGGLDAPSAKHGADRMKSGFDLAALISEYRALRASVIRLWHESCPRPDDSDLLDLTRFNETIDQSLTEAVVAYTQYVERERQAALDEQARRAAELREMNAVLLTSSVRQHELAEEAQRAEAAQRKSEERFRTLFELGPVAVYSCDASGVIREFNARAAELWGRAPALGDTNQRFCGSFKMMRPDGTVLAHERCPMAEVLSGAIPQVRDAEVHIERPDGSLVAVIVNIRPLKNEQGEITGAINCFYDITERKAAEKALRESEERYRMLFDSMDEGYCIIEVIFDDRKGGRKPVDYRFVKVNAAFEKQSGMHDVVGKRMLEFVSDIEDHWLRNYGTVALTGEPLRFAGPYHGLDRWFEVYAFRVDQPGENKVAVLFADITARKQAEEELRNAKQAAEGANRAKDTFLAVLSHELRTPLTPVLMTIAAMEFNPELPPALHDEVKMIRRNVELEARLIDDLLDLSRIASGKLRLSFEILGINDLLRQACETCRPQIREKGIHLHCDVVENAGEVVGDPARLQQVFWNLLNNAAKFTPEGGHIYLSAKRFGDNGHPPQPGQGEQVRVTVRDTGIGIAPEMLPRIFDAFEQGEVRITRQFGGMGLGLAICKALVEQHRGSIRAETDGPDKGSTFVVELPALSREQAAALGPSKLCPSAEAGAEPLRLMVVEDHADTAKVLGVLLRVKGHTVATATTAAAALALAGRQRFDLVISDLGLPDMTGYDLMKRLKKKYGTKGIAMSGYGMEEDIKKGEEAGFSDHLVKPVNLAQLEASIRRVTRKGESPSQSPSSKTGRR